MTSSDFIYLNVPALLQRYTNPSPAWEAIVRTWTATEIEFALRQGLLKPDADFLNKPWDEAVVRFSDYTAEGQAFLRTGAVDAWLKSCDRQGGVEAYGDVSELMRQLREFRAFRKRQV